jgi:opacity protein-like surface antigen
MKKIAYGTMILVLCAPAVLAQRNVMEDRSADPALLTWSDPTAWQFGLAYARMSRPVDLDGDEWTLRGDIVDASVGFYPAPWLLLYGQVGGSQGRLDDVQLEDPSAGAGGLLGVRVNLWQLYEGVQATAWRITLQLAGQYAFRTTQDEGDGDLQWGEALVMMPLDYHLSFARSFRNYYMAEFQSLAVYAGPAFSKLDGTWTRRGVEQDFEEVQAFGVVGGVELWLLENLSFGARADWFEGTSMQLTVHYRF